MKILGKNVQKVTQVLGYIVAGIFFIGISFLPSIQNASSSFLDPLRTKNISHNAVVIGIDDKTLQTLGAWPLDRQIFADFIDKLEAYQIQGVVFDVLFLEEKESDAKMKSSLEEPLFPIALAGKLYEETVLNPVYPLSDSIKVGYVNVQPDQDGKVRRASDALVVEGKCAQPLSLALISSSSCDVETKKRFLYPSALPEFSLVDVMQGTVPAALLKDKVLFVGATTLDLEDYFVGLSGNKIPGVHVHASMYASHTNNFFTLPVVGKGKIILLLLMLLAGFTIVSYIRKTFFQLLTLLAVMCTIGVAAVVLFDQGWELPALEMLFVLISSFVTATLTRYAHSRRENIFIRTMFSRYVNKDVLQSLLKNHTHIASGERRELSVLFSDLRGFTDFSETVSPEDLTKTLNEYFALMVAEIFKERGTVDKFIGDAVMAFWNAPLSTTDHELHATLAAVGMQEALSQFNQKNNLSLKMGIGIHRGEAVVGNIGGEERVSYTALGDTVNTASRIEGVTKRYDARIVISEDVAVKVKDRLKDGWHLRKLDEVRLKGKQKGIVLYEVTTLGLSAIQQYESAFALYQKSNFSGALELLQSDILAKDTPSEVLKKRINSGHIIQGFDGVFVFEEK
jgi:adenylate cyclase